MSRINDDDSPQLNRGDLAGFLGPNLRLIKAFETLQQAVAQVIPAAVNENTAAIVDMQTASSGIAAQARGAQGSADMIAAALDRLTTAVLTQRDHGATIERMQRQIADLQTITLGS